MSSLYMGFSGRKIDFVPCGQERGRQQGHLHKLFNVFVTNSLKSTEAKLVTCKISIFLPVSDAEQAGLSSA